MTELFRYAAFISYSGKDARFARRLHRALESYGIPASLGKFDLTGGGKKNRIYPVFRDREELSAGDLGERIEAALKASGALIVVCSPNSAASPWVQKEIEYFVGLGRRDRIFAVISNGAPTTDRTGADATSRCFPPSLCGDDRASADAGEPLAADARKGKDGFRNAWLKIVAGLIGVTPGQIVDRDRVLRRRRAFGTAAVWALAALSVGFAWSTESSWRPILDDYLSEWTYYDIVFSGPVLGLQTTSFAHGTRGTQVRFNGIIVGRVMSMSLDPENPTLVTARVGITPNLAIHRDSRARLHMMSDQTVIISIERGSPEEEVLRGGGLFGRGPRIEGVSEAPLIIINPGDDGPHGQQ